MDGFGVVVGRFDSGCLGSMIDGEKEQDLLTTFATHQGLRWWRVVLQYSGPLGRVLTTPNDH